MFFEEGIYKFNKPQGWTSFDVVNWVKHRAVTKKVGHAGTLDPLAEGLLVIAVGRKFTKQLNDIIGYDKEYIFEITFGVTTDTFDSEGQITAQQDNFDLTQADLVNIIPKYTGEIQQVPPMFSALKHQGKKLYELARAGKEVAREPRTIVIQEMELLDFYDKKAKIRVVCSKGTYIRTLCQDIGQELGMGAHMSALLRTRIGEFVLDEQSIKPVSQRKAVKEKVG